MPAALPCAVLAAIFNSLESRVPISRPPMQALRTWSTLSKSKPGAPSRLPRTRSTFHPGRASPSGFTVA